MAFTYLLGLVLAVLCPGSRIEPEEGSTRGGNAVATALWFSHQFAEPQALTPGKDRQLKSRLILALGKSKELDYGSVGDFFDKDEFKSIAGDGGVITVETMERMIRNRTPRSRQDLKPRIRHHADLLSTQFDMIEEGHRKPAAELVDWIVKNYQPGKRLGIIVICSHNTRRSMLGQTMGNIAAAYYGLPEIRFHSGGTDPDAFNPRSIAALKEIGVEIEPTGKEAPRGSKGNANPVYRVRWGQGAETHEFSKKYTDAHNPQSGFGAILVCSEADTACPKVEGAGLRLPVPYLDPKAFDGAPFEAAKYAERRDDEGRFMLSVMMQARRRLELDGKLK